MRKQGGECCCVLLFSSSSSVHVLQRELPSLCLCEGAAAFTICAVETLAGACVRAHADSRVCFCAAGIFALKDAAGPDAFTDTF